MGQRCVMKGSALRMMGQRRDELLRTAGQGKVNAGFPIRFGSGTEVDLIQGNVAMATIEHRKRIRHQQIVVNLLIGAAILEDQRNWGLCDRWRHGRPGCRWRGLRIRPWSVCRLLRFSLLRRRFVWAGGSVGVRLRSGVIRSRLRIVGIVVVGRTPVGGKVRIAPTPTGPQGNAPPIGAIQAEAVVVPIVVIPAGVIPAVRRVVWHPVVHGVWIRRAWARKSLASRA